MAKITDTERLEALARAMNSITLYEGPSRIMFKSNREHIVYTYPAALRPGFRAKTIRCGMAAELLREFADGLITAERKWQTEAKARAK
jgi:hypothetical protein